MRSHGVHRAIFAGHSFGSICVSWMLKHRRERVASVLLLDPVCFLLYLPNICRNFVYHNPKWYDRVRILSHYFVKREINIAETLGRNFWWYRNTLWADDLPENSAVLLGGDDEIAPAAEVYRYLQQHNHERSKQGAKPLQLLWYPKMRHAEYLFRPSIHEAIDRVLEKF